MGYSGLDNWVQSDGAADLRSKIEKKRPGEGFYKKVMAEDNGPYNTPGCVNIALLLEDGFIKTKEVGQKNMAALCERLLYLLEDAYDDELHREAYSRMLRFIVSKAKF